VRFRAAKAISLWPKIRANASPARRLSDLFWLSLPWERIAAELNGEVRVLEVGCGSGIYGVMMQECLGDAFAGYVGLDVARDAEWAQHESNPKMKLVCADSGTTEQYLEETNLIITQSALEHFDEDVAFFRQVAGYIARTRRRIVQIHLMPSAGCLSTYLWHGVRQYTPRTISRNTELFGPETVKRLYFLGSARCNRLHRRYITYPWLLGRSDPRESSPAAYDRELRQSVLSDEAASNGAEACFHALVLQSRLGQDMFHDAAQQHA
jgi:hypothetical protein